MNDTTISLRIPSDDGEKAKAQAAKQHLSLSQWIRNLITKTLKGIK